MNASLFAKDDFRYDETYAVYVCPVGHQLKPRSFHERWQLTDYVADKKVCAQGPVRAECTKQSRTVGCAAPGKR
jgi:hypothetical protein